MELHRAASNPISYTSNLKEMANEVASYHNTIQQKGLETPITQRELALSTALQDLPRIDDYDKPSLQDQLTYGDVELALK